MVSKFPPVRAKLRQVRGQQTHAAILAAAGSIFAEAGFAGARAESIAAAAGVNKALLFYYFKDMHGLYAAVLEAQSHDFHQEALALLAAPGSPRSILLRYVGLNFDRISEKRRFAPLHHQFFTTSHPSVSRLVRKYAVPRNQALKQLLERGIREGEFREVDVRHTAVSISALTVFYFSVAPVLKLFGHTHAYSDADLNCRKQQVLDFIRYGLFCQPDAPIPTL
jgi:TetR/AcrR family transcriptional regulator